MQSKTHFSRRSFLKTLAAAGLTAPFITSGWAARPPSSVLRHASIGASGMPWSDIQNLAKHKQFELVAVADVDLTKTANVRKVFPGARIYQDWRELLQAEGANLDSLNVGTPDHMHAAIAMTALQMGKHVYCQKPLAHDIFEVRQLTLEAAARPKQITQMGIQIHSTAAYRLGVLLIQAGTIGKIKEVHSWCPKSWGGDNTPPPPGGDPIPTGFNWDEWLGVAAARPFVGNSYYHPNNWRKRLDFGTGTFGDMGCHIFDPVFNALELSAPLSVRSEGEAPGQWNWANNSKVQYLFPGTRYTADKTINVTWYDGDQKLAPVVLEILEGDKAANTGSVFVGTNGAMLLPHVSRPMLYPDKKFESFKMPEVDGGDHWGSFVDACLGKARTTAGFDYSGPLTEAVLLGGVASRFPQTTMKWDSAALAFAEDPANAFLRRTYRAGWEVKGLSESRPSVPKRK